MNTFLKALIQELYDVEQAAADAVAKSWGALVTAGIKCGMDLPALVSSVGSAQSDLQALVSNPAADADLLADIQAVVGSADKASKAIVQAADLALSVLQLEPKLMGLVATLKA